MGVAGIEKAVVTLTTSQGHIEFDPAVLGPRDIIKIVEVRGRGGERASCGWWSRELRMNCGDLGDEGSTSGQVRMGRGRDEGWRSVPVRKVKDGDRHGEEVKEIE